MKNTIKNRQTDRQAGRQTDRQTDRQAGSFYVHYHPISHALVDFLHYHNCYHPSLFRSSTAG